MIATTCACGKKYQLADELAGRKVRCKTCQSIFQAPFPENLTVATILEAPPQEYALPPEEKPLKKKKKAKRKRRDDDELFDEDLFDPYAPSKAGMRSQQILSAFRYLGIGLLFMAIGAALFWFFSYKEEHGGFVRVFWLVALLYNLGGKWLCLILFGLLGLFMTVLSVLNFVGVSVTVNEG